MFLIAAAAAEPLTLDVRDAQPGFDRRTGQPILTIRLGDSSKAFAILTRRSIGRSMELRVDGKTVLKTVIREPLLGGFQIGGDSHDTYETLATQLKAQDAKVEVDIATD